MNRFAYKIDSILTKIVRCLYALRRGLGNFLPKLCLNMPELQAGHWPDDPEDQFLLKKKPIYPPAIPKYRVGEIVYLKFNPHQDAYDKGYPMIGGVYEIDCKIMTIQQDGYHKYPVYHLMTGTGKPLQTLEDELISASELNQAKSSETLSLIDSCRVMVSNCLTEIPAGTTFYKIDDWIINDSWGINIHTSYFNKNLTNLFNVVPRPSL